MSSNSLTRCVAIPGLQDVVVATPATFVDVSKDLKVVVVNIVCGLASVTLGVECGSLGSVCLLMFSNFRYVVNF